jgi:hypothetical protein
MCLPQLQLRELNFMLKMIKFRILLFASIMLCAYGSNAQQYPSYGNPVFPGWYADPDG